MKEKYEYIPLAAYPHYIKLIKEHWWNRWKVSRSGNGAPDIYQYDKNNKMFYLV